MPGVTWGALANFLQGQSGYIPSSAGNEINSGIIQDFIQNHAGEYGYNPTNGLQDAITRFGFRCLENYVDSYGDTAQGEGSISPLEPQVPME